MTVGRHSLDLDIRNARHFVSERGGHRQAGGLFAIEDAVLHVDSGRIPLRGNEQVGRFVWCRQEIDLGVVDGAAGSISLFLFEAAGNTEILELTVNGQVLEMEPDELSQGHHHWRSVRVPPGVLCDGVNRATLRSENLALNSWAIGVAVSDVNVGSEHSFDRGRSWHRSGLGTDQSLTGEYAIRWRVQRTRDDFLARTAAIVSTSGTVAVSDVVVDGRAQELEYRRGDLRDNDIHWRQWEPYRNEPLSEAAFQFRARVSSSDSVRSVGLNVDGEHVLVDPYSVDFVFEDPSAEATRGVRDELGLDSVVEGLNTDLERASALSSWIHDKWIHQSGESIYSPWHAPTIFAWQAANAAEGIAAPIGFCVHFGISLVQCASALGMKARAIILGQRGTEAYGGHFVAEIWCSEFNRWVCFDPDFDYHWLVGDEPAGVADVHLAVIEGRADQVQMSPGRSFTRNPMGETWPLKHVHEGGFLWFGLPKNQAWLSEPRARLMHHGAVNYHEVEVLWFDPDGAIASWAPERTTDISQFVGWRA